LEQKDGSLFTQLLILGKRGNILHEYFEGSDDLVLPLGMQDEHPSHYHETF
jgi:hypothetical protein